MDKPRPKKTGVTPGVGNFVDSMLKSAEEKKEVKPQTRYDDVDMTELDQLMASIKKGAVRR